MKHKLQLLALGCLLQTIYSIAHEQDALPEQEVASAMPLWLTGDDPTRKENHNLTKLLTRVGSNMRSSSDYHDFNDTTLDQALVSWKLLHERTERFSRAQVRYYRPKLAQLLLEANVSSSCSQSMKLTLDALERLEDWAVQSK